VNCAFAEFSQDARIVQVTSDNYYCGDFVPEFIIQNLGNDGDLTSANLSVSQYGNVLSTTSWSGSLSTYATESVSLPAVSNIDGGAPLLFSISLAGDMDSSNDSKEEIVAEVVTSQEIVLELLTDEYGDETSWDITDPDGNILATGTGYESETMYNETIELPMIGCFKFTLYDSYGDGICCAYGNGYIKLYDEWGNEIASGAEFTDELAVPFKNTQVSSVSDIDSNTIDLAVFPNPASNNVTVTFDAGNGNQTNLEIINSVGEVVYTESMGSINGKQSLLLDLEELSSGLYFLSVWNNEFKTTQELSIIK